MSHHEPKHLCERCRDRKARFSHRGVVKADASHTLCFACFRSERERVRARLLADPAPTVTAGLASHAPAGVRGPLTAAQRAHRFRMLSHLRNQVSGLRNQG